LQTANKSIQIIVVGAGPSGLLLALLLSRQGIHVQVLEATETLDVQPRATHYAPPAVYELRRAGVLDDVRAAGFIPGGVCWRKLDGTLLGALDGTVFPAEYPDQLACLPLDRLGKILERHLEKQPTAEILYGHRVVKLEQNDKKATVFVERKDREATEFTADFIVGCDGATSQIRRSLFGDWEFPGKTWDQQIVATNVGKYPFLLFCILILCLLTPFV
jgi:2-polyprenyl-6-methoxyphenol hydroxylase-like FAD-dependent oxidoreductase